MQSGQVLSMRSVDNVESSQNEFVPIPWLRRIFGCRHKKMSSPFTRGNHTYCTCVDCGARRQFNLEKWKLTGPYYNVPPSSLYDND